MVIVLQPRSANAIFVECVFTKRALNKSETIISATFVIKITLLYFFTILNLYDRFP